MPSGLSVSIAIADTRNGAVLVGFAPPSKTTRPLTLAPFEVTIMTFDTSSPPTVSGTEPDS